MRRYRIFYVIVIILFIKLTSFAQISFTPLPIQPPANMYSIVTDPANGDLYACSAGLVIYSNNQGLTWTKLAKTGLGILNVLYFSPGGVLYAGGNNSNAVTSCCGIAKYDKTAQTWSILTGAPLNITSIVADGSGNIYAGTGTTGNISPSPINYGTGISKFDGTNWTLQNTGMANLTGFAVLPAIKDLKILGNGDLVAATYGNGVIKYHANTWSQYGTGISNQNVNCLYVNAAGLLFAGTDANVSILNNNTWSVSNTGLPANKPVRAIVADAAANLFVGLGYYVYQKGSIAGEIFYSKDNGGSWQNAGQGFNSTSIVSMAINSNNMVFAAACGIWKAATPNNWGYSLSNLSIANNTSQLVENKQGDWFMICRNTSGAVPGCAGVFRSTDKGASWVSINNGINSQKTDFIFVDSYGWLWLSTKQFIGANLNPAFGNPELYKSADNGANWIKETTIVTPNDGYPYIAEDGTGKLFVANSFGQYQTNISSSVNHGAFTNNLNPPPNGDKAYGLAINSHNHVFLGTETGGLYRSTQGGTAGTFSSLTAGSALSAQGNESVIIDPYTDYIFSGGTHGQSNGSQIAKNFFGSSSTNNGTQMFAFNNLPDYTSFNSMAFDNRGNLYGNITSGSFTTTQGLWIGSFGATGWNSNTVFTRVVTVNSLSYFFNSMFIDDCGYLYGLNANGGGIIKSTLPVNTPLQSSLLTPANGATNISQNTTLTWTHKCMPDSFRIQVSADTLFTNIVTDQSVTGATSYQTISGTLQSGTKYYWRVNGVNVAGKGKWSQIFSFTTGVITATIDVALQNSISLYPNPCQSTLSFTKTLNGIKVYNSAGKLCIDKAGMLNHISTASLPDGMYFLSTKSVIKKFIVRH